MPHNPQDPQAALAPKALATLDDLLKTARRFGADASDAVWIASADMHAGCRHGKPEGIERAERTGVGLRAWVGRKSAVASSTATDKASLEALAERVVAMANVAPEDPESRLADASLLAREWADLDLYDAQEPPADWLMEQARAAEGAALAVSGVTNSEGAEAGFGQVTVALCTLPREGQGFAGTYQVSHASLSASVLAGEGTAMERDYDYATARHRADLPSPESIGRHAADRALRRLNPRRVATTQAAIVFDPRVSRSLLGQFAGAINGASIARGTSFLKDKMGQAIFSPGITIIDDPRRVRGLGSRPFDGEGVAGGRRALVEGGVLQSWLLDVRSAGKLGLTTTGSASRGLSAAPSPSVTNLYMEPGALSPEELLKQVGNGFYVTETIGMGVNLVTGDYSQGASGFWIENGEIAYPVSEVTIAGHLSEMFAHLVPANDLVYRYAVNAPTLCVEGMTIAGE